MAVQAQHKMLVPLVLTVSLSLLLGVQDASSTASVESQVMSKYRNLGKIIHWCTITEIEIINFSYVSDKNNFCFKITPWQGMP